MNKEIDKRLEKVKQDTKDLKKVVNECKFELKKMYLELSLKKSNLNK